MSDESSTIATNHHGRTGQRHGIAIGEGQIRRIFPVFVLAMWVTAGVLVAQGRWSSVSTVLVVEAVALCAIVFVNFVWVFNFGYAAAAVVLNATVLGLEGPSPAALLVGGVLVLYGIRLFAFALRRLRHPSFAARAAGVRSAHRTLPMPIKVLLWLQTSTLFTFHALTTYTLAATDAAISVWVAIGAAVMASGLGLETIADLQKQRGKERAPQRWVDRGLFSRSRHPNYLGEISLQVGLLVCALGAASALGWGWVVPAVVLAPTYIVLLMVSATTGAELAQAQRYGEDPEFEAYVGRTGALLPRLRS